MWWEQGCAVGNVARWAPQCSLDMHMLGWRRCMSRRACLVGGTGSSGGQQGLVNMQSQMCAGRLLQAW